MFPSPITLPVLGLTLRPHNALELLAVVGGSLLIVVLARRLEGLAARQTVGALILMTVCEYLFGRAHFVAAHWNTNPQSVFSIFRFWSSIHAAGAVFGAGVGAVLASRWLGLPLGRFADACVPAAGVGIAIARLGCFAHGCCFGSVCELPWCFSWARGTPTHSYQAEQQLISELAATSLPAHPLQLYFAAAGLGISAAALLLYRRKRYDGQIALFGLTAFALSTLWLESFRAYPAAQNWGPFAPLTWAALALVVGALGVTILRTRLVARRNS